MAKTQQFVGSLLLVTLAGLAAAHGQGLNLDRELIVLIAPPGNGPEAPVDPESVVLAINSGTQPVPGGFNVGDPLAARFAIPERATGRTRDWMLEHPDAPLARLSRYLIFTYASPTALPAVIDALRDNPHAEHVETNYAFQLATAGTDPLLIPPADGDPGSFQWAIYALNLINSWSHAKGGHTLVATLDRGLMVDHPDLQAFHRDPVTQELIFDGGNFRSHLSYDVRHNNCSVDERDPADGSLINTAGHGSAVNGIIASTYFNSYGTAGACPKCSIIAMRASAQGDTSVDMAMNLAGQALDLVVGEGAQIVNMSFGAPGLSCATDPDGLICTAMALADERDLILVASAGNERTSIYFPALDPRVISVGGLEPVPPAIGAFTFWDDFPLCPYGVGNPLVCGSNFGPEADLAAPAKTVLSTLYAGFTHNNTIQCGDAFFGAPDDGFGPCTGTSMSAPYVTAIAGLVRSVNPLLTKAEVRDVLISTASHATQFTPQLGFGAPDAGAAVRRALGEVRGQVMPNRLTPLFTLYSADALDHVATTSPQMAVSLIFGEHETYTPVGPTVPGYDCFPGTQCVISPLDPAPTASVYLFTTDAPPYPEAPPLVPLYRMNYDPNLANRCVRPPPARQPDRDYAYTTSAQGILRFKEDFVDNNSIGYELDGIEGYIYERCTPEPSCMPPGTVRLYRLYHPGRDDFAIFPETELAQWQAEGYISQPTLNSWIGYVYPNIDTDEDGLVDGFESLLGTNPALSDTDCDTISDGVEVLEYQMSDPSPANHGYSDPLDGPCIVFFRDGFETGNTSRWSVRVGG